MVYKKATTGVVQAAGRVNVNSGDEIIMTENVTMTETLEKIEGLGFDSRDRRKSKYLSYPYINFGARHNGLPPETEDLRTPCLSHKVEGSSIATTHSSGSPSFAKSGSKMFRRNWYRKFISSSTMSSSPEFINVSTDELLSGLYSKAVDCMFPTENKSFDLVEWFFCRFRISEYHDEAELATSLLNVKGGNIGKPMGNDLLDIKNDQKSRKNNKLKNAARHKMKSLSGLSDVNMRISSGDFLLKDCTELNIRRPRSKLKQRRRDEKVASWHLLQNVETTLNGSSAKCSSVPESSQSLSCLASEGEVGPKKRKKIEAALEHQSAQIASALLYTDAKNTKCSSFVIDLPLVSPATPGGIPEKSNGENKEELVLIGSNPELSVSQEGIVGNIDNHSFLGSTTSEVGIVLINKSGQNNRNREEEAAGEHLNTELATQIPDLNSTGSESNSIRKDFQNINCFSPELKSKYEKRSKTEEHLNAELAMQIPDLNGTFSESNSIRHEFENVNCISPELKSKYEKRSQAEPKSEQSRSLSVGMRPTKVINFNRVEANGEALGTCLLLQFSPGVCVPSKEDLLAIFCQFGPLKESETQLLRDTSSAQIVFVRSTDAWEAFRSLDQSKPFGLTLVDYKLHHLSATCPPVEQFVSHAQPPWSMSRPGESPPPLDFMRQNLLMMTSTLEKSGNNLSPQMRAKLDSEIKNLLKKVNSLSCSLSTKV